MLAKRDLKNRYASSYAGIAWNIGVPLLYSLINVLVFSVLMTGRMGERYGDIPFALFYFVPFSLWTVFSEVVGRSPTILKDYSYLINKIAFPAWVLPLVPLASALLSQVIILCITLGIMLSSNVAIAKSAWVFLVIWALWLALTLGIAYAVAAFSVYVPDLLQAVPVCVNILFWLTPILYSAKLVEDSGAGWLRNIIMTFNPFTYLVEFSRHAVFGSAVISWNTIGVLCVVCASSLAVGLFIFRRLQPGFADII